MFLFLFFLFRAALAAYGSSQARGLIGATAASLHHSSQQRRILNPLTETRDQTLNLMVPSRIRFHCAMMGTPNGIFLNSENESIKGNLKGTTEPKHLQVTDKDTGIQKDRSSYRGSVVNKPD